MQTNISHTDPISEIELALKSQGIAYAAKLLHDYKADETDSIENQNRLLEIRLKILINQGRYEDLKELVSQSISEEPRLKAKLSVAKGILSNRQADFRQSLIRFLEAESLAKEDDDEELWAQIQINIGTAFASLHYYKEGSDRYQSVLINHDEILSARTKAVLLHNLGNLYYATGQIDRSIKSLTDSISLSNDMEDLGLVEKSTVLLTRAQLKKGYVSNLNDTAIDASDDLYPVYRFCRALINDEKQRTTDLKQVISLAQTRNDFLTQIESRQLLIQLQQSNGDLLGAIETLEGLRSVETELRRIQEDARLVEQAAKFDILEKERAIQSLKKENELQQEIVKRNEMLEVANEDLRQFAYVVSHDLKEPLRMIGSYTQLIEMAAKNKLSDENKEYFEFVKGGVDRLNVLLDGLSSYSTLKSLQESKELINLSEIVDVAKENLDFVINESNAEITLDEDITINGSRALLVLLFQNLLQNAIKFRKSDLSPKVKICPIPHRNGVHIDISDNGIGMPESQKERIFVIFQRLSRANQDGSGMGLAICKKIVQLHKGKIFVQGSKEGEGTTFRLELPN